MSSCVGCGAALPAEAKFCGVCGRPAAAMAAAAPPQTAPAPPPMPQMPQMTRGFSSSGGQSKQATFTGSPQEAFAQATRAISASGGELTWQQPPQAAKFLLIRKSFWGTGGIPLKYDGDLQVMPAAPGQTTARFALKLQWNSAVPLLLMQVAAVIIAAMFNYYIAAFALILIVASLAFTAWNASSGVPDKALDDIIRALQSGGAAPSYAPPAQTPPSAPYTPQPAPAPQATAPAPTPPASAPAPNGADTAAIVEQIKQLASLRDAGAITADEFEAKKKDLLSRI